MSVLSLRSFLFHNRNFKYFDVFSFIFANFIFYCEFGKNWTINEKTADVFCFIKFVIFIYIILN